jgi:ABC-type phosphate transport system substrate-binding protein
VRRPRLGGRLNLSGTLNGSGSTFQLTFQQEAIAAFKSIQPELTVNYGGGRLRQGPHRPGRGTGPASQGSDSPIPAKEASGFHG